MNVQVNKIDDLNLELTIGIEAADYAEIERKKLAQRRKTADFKGFRKGNVPASLIKKVYGEQCLVEAVNSVIADALDKHISENNLHILGEPLGSEKQPELEWVDGGDFTFIFDLALSPEVNFEGEKSDTVPSYTITVAAKDKTSMAESMKKYYEEKKEEKSDEDIDKEVSERLEAQYKNEAEWRLNKDIRDYFVQKAALQLPEAFLKRWLLQANEGKVTEEQMEKEFPAFLEDFKWQLVRGFLMKKYDFKITADDLREAATANMKYQYAMYGINEVPEDVISEAVTSMLQDQKQVDRLAEQVEDKKVIEQIKSEIKISSKKISSEKFKALA